MKRMRVAVWGLGRHAINRILPVVSAASGLELFGVCSRNPGSVSACSEKWKCKGWTEASSMLLDPDVDIVYVATPSNLHAEHGKRVLDARKHFWCEKPLTCELRHTLDLLELSRTYGLSIGEGFMYLRHPQFHQLAKYVTDGRLGSIKSIGCRFGIPPLEHPGFRSDANLGGGALFDVGCYPISALQALFPEEHPELRHANVVRRNGSTVDTDGLAVFALSNGAVAILEWGINCAYRNEIDIWGEEGSVFSNKIFSKPVDHVPEFRLRDSRGVESIEYGDANDHFSSMLECFRGMIDDLASAEMERRRICRRAELLDRIWSVSRDRP
jgi:predicted dehydrogenase